MEQSEATESLEIHGLTPEPAAEWQRLLAFVGLGAADKRAMSRTVEVLMSRATEMVIGVYDYLQSVPATAAVLGWENGADPHHLEERRRFFTIWLSRVLGLDTSDEFAAHLFRAGKYHAAHGPRHIHVPPAYVTMSIGMMGAAFARIMGEAGLPGDVIGPAMAGWNKYLAVQLHLMDMGYRAAIEFGGGESPSAPLPARATRWKTACAASSTTCPNCAPTACVPFGTPTRKTTPRGSRSTRATRPPLAAGASCSTVATPPMPTALPPPSAPAIRSASSHPAAEPHTPGMEVNPIH